MTTIYSTSYQLDDVFYKHKNTLWNERRKTEEALNDWYQSLKERIDKYRSDQTNLIAIAYDNQSQVLIKLHEQAKEEYLICYRRSDNKQIKDLIERCKNIQLRLMTLNIVVKEEKYLALKQAKEITLMDDEPSTNRTENRPAPSAASNSAYADVSGYQFYDGTSYSNPNAAEKNQSMNSSKQMNNSFENDIDPNNCLVCFMEFPETMSRTQKRLHIEKHFDYLS